MKLYTYVGSAKQGLAGLTQGEDFKAEDQVLGGSPLHNGLKGRGGREWSDWMKTCLNFRE